MVVLQQQLQAPRQGGCGQPSDRQQATIISVTPTLPPNFASIRVGVTRACLLVRGNTTLMIQQCGATYEDQLIKAVPPLLAISFGACR
jgi:hypothetical protein